MNIEPGWRFNSADFSAVNFGRHVFGRVTLVREPEDYDKWYEQDDEIRTSDDCPPLYVLGEGKTLEKAIANANMQARLAAPIKQVDLQG